MRAFFWLFVDISGRRARDEWGKERRGEGGGGGVEAVRSGAGAIRIGWRYG